LNERSAATYSTIKYGNTPLMFAACNCKLEIYRYLKEIDADIIKLNVKNISVLHLAISIRDSKTTLFYFGFIARIFSNFK
jgi:ankyrin repeat protein